MDDILKLISSKYFWALVKLFLIYCAYSAVVGALDMPTAQSPKWWRIMFAVLNGFAANLTRGWHAIFHIPPDPAKP